MSNPPAGVERGERLTRSLLLAAFWVPLSICTWLALAPSPPTSVFRISDVLLHGFAFSYLTFALGLARPRTSMAALVVWMLGYGVFIEAVQSLEPTRDAEIKDLLVDAAGIALGLVLLRYLGHWTRRTLHHLLG